MKNDPLKKAVLIEKSTTLFKYVYIYVVWETKIMSYNETMRAL
jgi:hypothetical protein